MKPGEEFEIRCYEYLKAVYSAKNATFQREGGMDATKSDIAVIKNGNVDFFIEVKDSAAQSGQFVVLPDQDSQSFVFSSRNHSAPNEMTEIIIDYMNQHFDKFNNAGTAGKTLNINSEVFSNWVMNHYRNKNVKYFISYKDNYVILPIRRFSSYFDILAKYRIKKSGSRQPAKKDVPIVQQIIQNFYPTASFEQTGKKLFASISETINQDHFPLGKYTYYLSEQTPQYYEIRCLSNTYNMNVIFSIYLKKSQDSFDLEEFESDL